MFKKFLNILKSTAILWLCILFPIVIAFSYIKSSSESNIKRYMDSYIDSEATCLAKYIGLQLKNTEKQILGISNDIILSMNPNYSNKKLKELSGSDSNIIALNLYDKQGKAIFRSNDNEEELIDVKKQAIYDLKDRDCTFALKQLEDGSVGIEYIMRRDIGDEENSFLLNITMKWSQYENFLDRLQEGSFPRKFFIISPDCKRYLSLNSLPHGAESDRNLIALGLHLASKINSIKLGSSDIKLEDFSYRVFKSEIKLPHNLDGSQLFIISVIDDDAIQVISKGILSGLPLIIFILLFIWLCISIFVSKSFSDKQGEIDIANTITDFTPSAVVVFQQESGKIKKINRSGLTLLRLMKEQISNVNIWDIFISKKDKDYINNAVKSNVSVLNYEILVQSFGGGSFWSICSICPIVINQQTYIVLSILDINRRKEIEKKLANNAELLEKQVEARTHDLEQKAKESQELVQKLEIATKEANVANAAKSKFLTCMSNELKTPIDAIIGYSEILKEEATDRKDNVSADDLSKIIGSAKHLLSLINEILDLSSIEAGKTQLFFENIHINEVLKEIEGVSMPLTIKNENSLLIESPKSIGDMYTDQTKLRQCLLNLIGNAAKFTEFGKITLRVNVIVKEGVDFIEFSVIDTGCGISKDKLEEIFQSFNNDSNQNLGTGLGLTITKKYVECMGGTISVESDLGVGSKFTIKLPRICTVESSDAIEIKNQKEEEILDEFIEETEEEIESAEKNDEVNTFSKISEEQ